MDKKTEPQNFATRFIAEAPGFMEQKEGINWIKKSDLTRLFNQFQYTFTDAEFEAIMVAHANGIIPFIQALEHAFQPICTRFFNEDMTQLKEPFREQIRAHFGKSQTEVAVGAFNTSIGLLLHHHYAQVDDYNASPEDKIQLKKQFRDSIDPINAYRKAKQERIDALLKLVPSGDEEEMKKAIEVYKIEEEKALEVFIEKLKDFAKNSPSRNIDCSEESIKKFRKMENESINFTADSFALSNDQYLANQALNGIVASYNQALTTYPKTKRAREEKQSEHVKQTLEEKEAFQKARDIKERDETLMTADIMADIGVLVNTVSTTPDSKHIFNKSEEFLRNDRAFHTVEEVILEKKKRKLEMEKTLLIDEMFRCIQELRNEAQITYGPGLEKLNILANNLEGLVNYIEVNCNPLENDYQQLGTVHATIENHVNEAVTPYMPVTPDTPLDTDWRANLARGLTTFLNFFASLLNYAYRDDETIQATLHATTEHEGHAVTDAITTFKSKLEGLKTSPDKKRDNFVLAAQHEKQKVLLHAKAEEDAQALSEVKLQYGESPVVITEPQTNKQGTPLEDWRRAWDQGEVSINGKPLKECTEQFKTEEDISMFFKDVFLKHMSAADQNKAVDYLQKHFHQTGLLFPVARGVEDLLRQTTQNNPKWGTPSPYSKPGEITRKVNLIPTDHGFQIDDQTTFKSLLLAPHPDTGAVNRFVAYANDDGLTLSAEEKDQPIIKAHGVVDVDFSTDPAQPKLTAPTNTITYGHRALAFTIHDEPPLGLNAKIKSPDLDYTTSEDESSDDEQTPFFSSKKT
jgi:hypothetical protein